MAKAKLSPNEIARIVGMLDTWDGSLSWERVSAALPEAVGRSFTIQTLRRHTSILNAFSHAKARLQAVRVLAKTGLDDAVSRRFLLGLAGSPDLAPIPRLKRIGTWTQRR